MIHIVFILSRLYPCESGGVELFHYYFTRFLEQHYNVKITILTNCDALKQYESNKFKIVVIPSKLFGKSSLAAFFYHMSFFFRNRKNIDLIYTPYDSKSWYAPYHLILTEIFFSIPYILRISGGKMHPESPAFLHNLLFRFSTGRITVSAPMKVEYEKRHSKMIKCIPSMLPFIESEKSKSNIRKSFGIKENRIIILFVGSVKKMKGPDLLFEAFCHLGKDYIQNNRLHLIYAGDGKMLENLKTNTKKLAMNDYVTYLGHVQHKNICDVYKASDIFIIPSLWEARPLSLSEALFNGLAIIGSDIPTIKNIIKSGENGLLFKTGSPEHLAIKIKKLIEDRVLRLRLGSNAKTKYCSNYSYESMVDEYNNYLLKCV